MTYLEPQYPSEFVNTFDTLIGALVTKCPETRPLCQKQTQASKNKQTQINANKLTQTTK